jgi:hypothetical protein
MPKQIFLGLIVGSVLSMSTARATIACNFAALPSELQQRLKTDFPSWKIQDSGNLTENAKARWQAEKPVACPGIAVGHFESPTHLSYAVLLVPLRNPESAYRFLVFTPKNEAQGDLTVVESSDAPSAANGFVRTVPLTKVFNADWRRKLNAGGSEGILFVDAGLDEYEADVYFWSEGKYHHEPIDD